MEQNTQLQVVNQQPLNIVEMQKLAEIFAASGNFTSVNSMAKAFIKIQAGLEMGIAPFAAMSGIHIIKEKAQIGAGLMAGKIKASQKYDYDVVELNDKKCILDFFENGKKKGTETFTIEDARKAGTQNLEKFPKNMLFARAISNGIKFYAPDLYTMPVYVPGEIPNETIDVQHEEVDTKSYIDIAKGTLEQCTSLKDLEAAFKSFPKEIQFKLVAIKDEMKAKLTPPAQVATPPTQATTAENPTMLLQSTDKPLPNEFNPEAL